MENREKEILIMTIEYFINTAMPVSSNNLIKTNKLNWSGATIRSIMNNLEKKGYLTKAHNQSGRIPTTLGYKIYNESLNTLDLKKETYDVVKKIDKIFNQRYKNIDNLIKETIDIISGITNLVTIAKTTNKDSILEAINLFSIDDKKSVITVVISNEKIFTNVIDNPTGSGTKDLSNAIEIFNLRLKGTKLRDLDNLLVEIKPIITKKVKRAEKIFEWFVSEIFNNLINEINYQSGISNIINYNSNYQSLNIENLLKIIEDNSIWSIIKETDNSYKVSAKNNELIFKDENDPNLKNIVFIDKKIKINGKTTSIAMAAPTRIKYKEISAIFNWFEKKLKEISIKEGKGGDNGNSESK